MVAATRRAAKKAPAAPAPSNTLNAPAKRGRKKVAADEAAAEPAPAAVKPTRATATKRKAAEAELSEMPAAKKTTASKKVTRAKVETKAEPAPSAPKRATRGKKVVEPAVREPAVAEETSKPTTTRSRKAPAKKAAASQPEEPVIAAEPAEEAPKPASRARRAPAKKTAAVTKFIEASVAAEDVIATTEPVKPAPRGRKAAVPKLSSSVPTITSRPTRGRNAAAPPPESPLKAPARKPTSKKAAAAVIPKVELVAPEQEIFAEFPGYPTTPAHITAPISSRAAMAELAQYPNTPAHIKAPISSKEALAALPDYPKTPAHITAPISSKAALAELAGYPKTPANIKAPSTSKDSLNELPDYPKGSALTALIYVSDATAELPAYSNASAHIAAPEQSTTLEQLAQTPEKAAVLQELPSYPNTPAHIVAPISTMDALKEMPEYPKTPAHIQAPLSSLRAMAELPDYPKTPAHNTQHATPTPSTGGFSDLPADCQATPAHVSSPVIAEQVPEEIAGPRTPTQITWGVTDQEAFAELPEYPKTPSHIIPPVTNQEALAELPSYPATPAQIEAAVQEEILASVKKGTPSPSPSRMTNITETSEVTLEVSDVEMIDVDDLTPPVLDFASKVLFAPIQPAASLTALVLASPVKSALRSPSKMDAKTPKKAVTWVEAEESELFMFGGPLQGTTFFVDIKSQGKQQDYLFTSLLKDLGAEVLTEWIDYEITHVLFKDGELDTLRRVVASKGKIKCVNVGWAIDCESNQKRMEEGPYLVDLSVAMPQSPASQTLMRPFTPARTPSKYALPPSSQGKDIPSTPTSSEFDRSINVDDDKENSELGLFWKDEFFKTGPRIHGPRTCPSKKNNSTLFSRSPMKTPSKPSFIQNTPVKPMSVGRPFSTTKKRSFESSFSGINMAPPKKLRLF